MSTEHQNSYLFTKEIANSPEQCRIEGGAEGCSTRQARCGSAIEEGFPTDPIWAVGSAYSRYAQSRYRDGVPEVPAWSNFSVHPERQSDF